MDDWEVLAQRVRWAGYEARNVEDLVRFAGAQKAGARVMEGVEKKLADHNIGHLPTKLPTDSTRRVLLYSKEHNGVGYLLSLVHELALQEPADERNATVHLLDFALREVNSLKLNADARGVNRPWAPQA
ncbi:hypothetical protein EV284_6448 [Streptomyces sp. BK022]|uniref:hypothetical protein n=1 Tax=Streptomyces sp. BK022 TaxID=2512123 RepID=UPI0010295295|nr:hypothetical protein [Streptomyces sp. BK022]RZU28282.1 hypothetical protein EV284_6448 [Streptomyces sp. BK022]